MSETDRWIILHGDILNVVADILVCSANVQLNMSGGVGGSILVRYGNEMQKELRQYLADHRIACVAPGTVVPVSSCGTPFRWVLHAVAIDAFYQTSRSLVASTLQRALEMCNEKGAETVALTALATGYGCFPIDQFAEAVMELDQKKFFGIKRIFIVLENKEKADELSRLIKEKSAPKNF